MKRKSGSRAKQTLQYDDEVTFKLTCWKKGELIPSWWFLIEVVFFTDICCRVSESLEMILPNHLNLIQLAQMLLKRPADVLRPDDLRTSAHTVAVPLFPCGVQKYHH